MFCLHPLWAVRTHFTHAASQQSMPNPVDPHYLPEQRQQKSLQICYQPLQDPDSPIFC